MEKVTAGLEIPYVTTRFENDLTTFKTADDVLTLLTHFGYFPCDMEKGVGRIPNYEGYHSLRKETNLWLKYIVIQNVRRAKKL